jgi:signal transduction histidine kinase
MATYVKRTGERSKLTDLGDLSPDEQWPYSNWSEVGESEHFVQFYESDEFFLDSVTGYVGAGLSAGDACVLVTTPGHRQALELHLAVSGLDLADAQARGVCVCLDAAEILSRFMVDGMPEPHRFVAVVGGAIARAAEGQRHVRVFGEMVALLWAEGNQDAAIRLEELWNDLQGVVQPFSLFCAYPMQGFAGEVYGDPFGEICQRHSRVIPDESYSALTSPEERLRAITHLQQKASSLAAEIAERKAVEEALTQALGRERAARAEAEAANARMDEFLGVAGHELRTPLTTIHANIQLLSRKVTAMSEREEAVPEGLTRMLAQSLGMLVRMNGSAKRLGRLVDDLLEVSRIKAGKLEMRLEPADLVAIVREIVAEQRQLHPKRTIQLETPAQAVIAIVADADRLGQVMTNYLSNALKYSANEEPVAVTIRVEGHSAHVLVRDGGSGIAAEEQEHIWDLFYRVPGCEVRSGSGMGLGLGLHISKTIVELHGGSVGLVGAPGEGSTFWFSVPLAASDASVEE